MLFLISVGIEVFPKLLATVKNRITKTLIEAAIVIIIFLLRPKGC